MASRRRLKARAEQCCHLTAWSSIFEKVWNCHFLSRRWHSQHYSALWKRARGTARRQYLSFCYIKSCCLWWLVKKTLPEQVLKVVVGKGRCWTCWSGSGSSPGLQSCVHSSHVVFGEGHVGSWPRTWTTPKKDSSDQMCLVVVVESVSSSWVSPLPWLLVWMPPALTTALLCWALQGCLPKQYLSVLHLFLCKTWFGSDMFSCKGFHLFVQNDMWK